MASAPFKFLDSYTREDQEIFFGREKEVEELYYKIFEGNLLIVYGSSGTGKTSLIQCGLASKFQDSDWMPVIIRRGNNINESIKKSLEQAAITPLRKKNNLPQNIQSIYLDYFKPMFMLFDQFEELFIFGSDEEIAQFTDDIKECLESNLSCRFIFVIRGEYLENISRFEEKIPEFFNNRIRIERMTRKNALRVITEPARLFSINVSEDFPSKVLEKLGADKASVELTYLQVYLDKLYKIAVARNPEHPEFNDALLEKSGRIDDVLAGFLDEQINKTKNPEHALTVLKSFVSNEGTKKQMTERDVHEFTMTMGKQIPKEETDLYTRQFVDLRILKDKDENGKYELRHDALAAKIFEQISYTEKELIEVRQFILNRYNDFKKRGAYLEHSDIQYIMPYEKKMYLNPEQKEFIDKSVKISRLKRNRRRNIFAGLGTLAIFILAGFSIYALRQRNDAIQQSKIAEQKTREALNQKELAEAAKNTAMEASRKALDAKSYAELQENLAKQAKQIADSQEHNAEYQKQVAQEQSHEAKTQAEKAREEEALATQKSKEALQEKTMADSAQSEATRLRMVGLSQNIAFKAIQVKNNPQLAALLSCEAYFLATDNNGNPQDPQMYSSLYQSLKNVDPAACPVIIHTASDIMSMDVSEVNSQLFVWLAGGNLDSYAEDNKQINNKHLDAAAANTAYVSGDGKYAITGYDDNSVKIWDVFSGTGSAALQGHTGLIRAAAFSTDGKLFATGGRDSAVITWKNHVADKIIKVSSRIKSLALSGDKSKLLVGCEDGNIFMCNPNTGDKQLMATLPGRIQDAVYSSNEKYIVASSSNGQIGIYDATGRPIKTLNENKSVDFIAANDATGLLAEAAGNKVIHLYKLNDLSQKPIEIADIPNPIRAFNLSTDGNVIVALSNNTIRKYPVYSATLEKILYSKITRNLTMDEWNANIDKDVPFRKINDKLK